MRYHNITHDDMLNGEGLRTVLWVSGCSHHCPSCHNQITHDVNGGISFDDKAKKELFEELSKDYISGVTFSGGDPLHYDNREEITFLAKEIREKFPNKTIWCYTGYSYEDVKDLPIMQYLDVLCDGRFILALKDEKCHWVGSTNQRVIHVQKTKEMNQIVLWEEKR